MVASAAGRPDPTKLTTDVTPVGNVYTPLNASAVGV
jgi:hypothetical protein